jgi:hypothetical protein
MNIDQDIGRKNSYDEIRANDFTIERQSKDLDERDRQLIEEIMKYKNKNPQKRITKIRTESIDRQSSRMSMDEGTRTDNHSLIVEIDDPDYVYNDDFDEIFEEEQINIVDSIDKEYIPDDNKNENKI